MLILLALTVAVVIVAFINAVYRLTRGAILAMMVVIVVAFAVGGFAGVALVRASVARERAACVAQGGALVEREGRYVGCIRIAPR